MKQSQENGLKPHFGPNSWADNRASSLSNSRLQFQLFQQKKPKRSEIIKMFNIYSIEFHQNL